jgi:hypothetical protein
MAAFIVVPKVHNGRHTSYEIIDTRADKPYRARLGYVDDEHLATAIAETLNGAEKPLRATLAELDRSEAF